MIVVHISDTHVSTTGGGAAARADGLSRCVAAINRLRPRPDVVVHTGDLTQNGAPEEYALARRILEPLMIPLYIVPGNRDRRQGLRQEFRVDGYLPDEGEFLHYTVEHHAVRLVALDSVIVGRGHGGLCAERLAWLEATLAAAPDRLTVLLLHHPPFDNTRGPLTGFVCADNAAAAAAALDRHPQVKRVLCGHAHLAAECPLGGALVSTMPSIAVDLRRDGGPDDPDAAPVVHLHALDPTTGIISRSQFAGA